MIKKFEAYLPKDDVGIISDYFIEWIDNKKYNIKIVKSPAKKAPIFKGDRVNYNINAGEVTKKGSYVIRFEVSNNTDDILMFISGLNDIIKRWKIKNKMDSSSVRGNKIIFSLQL